MFLDTLRGQWLVYEIHINNPQPHKSWMHQSSADIAELAPACLSRGDQQGWGRDSPRAQPLRRSCPWAPPAHQHHI